MSQTGERKIHVRVEGELHRLLRIRCAELDLTIQDYVVHLLERNLRNSLLQPEEDAAPVMQPHEGGMRKARKVAT